MEDKKVDGLCKAKNEADKASKKFATKKAQDLKVTPNPDRYLEALKKVYGVSEDGTVTIPHFKTDHEIELLCEFYASSLESGGQNPPEEDPDRD